MYVGSGRNLTTRLLGLFSNGWMIVFFIVFPSKFRHVLFLMKKNREHQRIIDSGAYKCEVQRRVLYSNKEGFSIAEHLNEFQNIVNQLSSMKMSCNHCCCLVPYWVVGKHWWFLLGAVCFA